MAEIDKKHKFSENIENVITSIVVDDEYEISRRAKGEETAELESILDMLECKRTEKEYSWMSDVFIPELPSIFLTDASAWANQYFQTRDFVEVKLEGADPKDKGKCEAAKRCINTTLNNRKIYHYMKYIRARTINAAIGQVYALAWWEQKVVPKVVGYEDKKVPLDVDIYGNALVDLENQTPAYNITQEPVYDEDIQVDQFNYEILDPRNVFTDNTYCYSLQDKKWITVRSETSYEELKAQEQDKGYFNLDIVKELAKGQKQQTETARETYERDEQQKEGEKSPIKSFDKLLRLGKFWMVDGKPAYNAEGELSDKAELVEAIVETVIVGKTRVLIRFQPTPYRDSKGNAYRSIVRGWCYIHPTKDTGLSDGKYLRENQIAINDHFNMGSDRVKLATLPTLKGNKYSLEDNSTIYFEPQHVMEMENPEKDLIEFQIKDNIDGTLQVISMLQNMDQRTAAVYPTTMGAMPEAASTTATAVAGAESRTNLRGNYKSLTFEYTFLLDFYWMILQMTYAFARPQTALNMMGEYAEAFDPDQDYSYSPLSSNIEVEYNKYKKLSVIDQMVGRIVSIPNPKTPILLNYMLMKAFELMGDEFPDFKDYLLDTSQQSQQLAMGQGGGGAETPANLQPAATSNQNGQPQLGLEEFARNRMM